MSTTNLQIPISKELKKTAEAEALKMGFSSLQDTIRVFLRQLAEKKVDITFTLPKNIPEQELSPRAIKRYDRIAKEIEQGKGVYMVHDVDDLMKKLEE